MEQIRFGLESKVDVSIYADPKFHEYQMNAIREGLESGIDVSVYADTKYDYDQMDAIRKGLVEGVDVSIYADPKIGWRQMIRKKKQWQERNSNKLVGIIKNAREDSIVDELKQYDIDGTIFDEKQLLELRKGMKSKLRPGVDITKYADPAFDHDKMEQIRLGLKHGIDVSSYANPHFATAKMKSIRLELEKENDKSGFMNLF